MSGLKQFQSPTAKAPVKKQVFQQHEWSPPSLRVNKIAAITEGGFSSLMDNCGDPADGGLCQ